jgi:hypothetical protein
MRHSYKIISAKDIQSLEITVEDYINNGWKLKWWFVNTKNWYCQTIYKPITPMN